MAQTTSATSTQNTADPLVHGQSHPIRTGIIYAIKVVVYVAVYRLFQWVFLETNRYLETLGLDADRRDQHLFLTVTMIVHFSVFWIFGGFLVIVDVLHWPEFLHRYKIQKKRQLGWSGTWAVSKRVLYNQLLLAIPTFVVFMPAMRANVSTSLGELPTIWETLQGFLVCVAVEETLFFWSHWLIHKPALYKMIHKVHHDVPFPIGIASEYAHPIEFIFSNVMPVQLGPVVAGLLLPCGAHVTLLWMWMFIAICSTVDGHSGYEFPWSPFGSTLKHDYHHSAFRDNYGATGFFDKLMGTDQRWNKHVEKHDLYVKP